MRGRRCGEWLIGWGILMVASNGGFLFCVGAHPRYSPEVADALRI